MKISVIHSAYIEPKHEADTSSEAFSEDRALEYIRSNLEKNYRMLREAGEKKSDLAVTNEDFGNIGNYLRNTQYPKLFYDLVKGLEKEIAENLSDIARKYGMNIAANEYQTENGQVYNTSVFIDRRGVPIGRQRKVHLPPGERFKAVPGERPVVISTDIGVIGFCICYDMLFPEHCRTLALMGADIILHQSQGWGFGGAPAAKAGEAIVRTRAFENSVYLVVAKNIQNEGGMSCILDTYGDILAYAPGRNEQVLTAELSPDFSESDKYIFDNYYAGLESGKARKFLGRRPDAYGILTDPNPKILENFPGARLCTENELDSLIRALIDMEKNNPEERQKYHWHSKL